MKINKNFFVINTLLFILTLNSAQMKAQNKDYRTMIENAIKAPSGHNTQPWLFEIYENKIEIHPNFSKALAIVDNNHRELFISLGCATENLCIAASTMNYASNVDVSDVGIITVWLNKSDSVVPNALFDQIERRQTNRSIYESRSVPNDTLLKCISSVEKDDNINIHFWDKQSPVFDTLKQFVVKANTIQMNNELFTDELKSWMRFNKKDSESKNDGLSYATFGAPNLPYFIAKPVVSSFLNSKKQNKGDIKKIDSSSHFILFTAKSNTIKDWVSLGRNLQRFLLVTTQAGIANAYMNQPCEVEELAKSMQKTLPINDETPELLLRIGYAEQAPFSKRKNIEEVIIGD